MLTTFTVLALLSLPPHSPSIAAEDERKLNVVVGRGFPAIETVTVFARKDGKRVKVAEANKLDKPIALEGEGPFEVDVKPKGGIPIRIAEKVAVKAGETKELNLIELVGFVEVFGDDLPRADKVVLTDPRDPGPGEKGHVAIQTAGDYRVDMVVLPGAYAVWVVPANGAKAVRVAENVRVLAGKSIRVGD